MRKPLTFKDVNFFTKLNVVETQFVDTQCAKWNFISVGIALLNESLDAGDVVQYSFDKKTVHGDLTPTLPSCGIVFDNRHQSGVWFRRATPGSAVVVRVEAWNNDS